MDHSDERLAVPYVCISLDVHVCVCASELLVHLIFLCGISHHCVYENKGWSSYQQSVCFRVTTACTSWSSQRRAPT